VLEESGTESCFNIGRCGCFIPRVSENLAKSLLDEGAICAMVIKQQKLLIPVTLKCAKDNMVKVWLYNPHIPCLFLNEY
jgi:hypothetical protein